MKRKDSKDTAKWVEAEFRKWHKWVGDDKDAAIVSALLVLAHSVRLVSAAIIRAIEGRK